MSKVSSSGKPIEVNTLSPAEERYAIEAVRHVILTAKLWQQAVGVDGPGTDAILNAVQELGRATDAMRDDGGAE